MAIPDDELPRFMPFFVRHNGFSPGVAMTAPGATIMYKKSEKYAGIKR